MLGAFVPAMLLATWWVRTPSMTGGVGNLAHTGKITLNPVGQAANV